MSDKLQKAMEAANAVFSDMSVTPAETKERLQRLRDEIDIMMDSLDD